MEFVVSSMIGSSHILVIENNLFQLVVPCQIPNLLHVDSHKDLSSALFFSFCILMTLKTALMFFTFIFLLMTQTYFMQIRALALEMTMNNHLKTVNAWLICNKLSLNIEKSSFVIFHPPQKKLNHHITLSINGKVLKKDASIKYSGIMINSILNWKSHISYIANKVRRRSIGVLSKLRLYVNTNILTQLYYSFIFPFLTYGLITWGNTYQSTLKPIVTLQKKALRIMSFAKYDEHTSPV